MPVIACLHTSKAHIPTFDRLIGERAPEAKVRHVVREAWLDRARASGLSRELGVAARAEMTEQAKTADAVLCTCSTFGAIADEIGERVIRIDRPMMERAADIPATILVAYCLDTARDATAALLTECQLAVGRTDAVAMLDCSAAWPEFERGDLEAFGKSIARRVRRACDVLKDPGCVALAQASMAAALPHLDGLEVPALASPPLAADAAVATARAHAGPDYPRMAAAVGS